MRKTFLILSLCTSILLWYNSCSNKSEVSGSVEVSDLVEQTSIPPTRKAPIGLADMAYSSTTELDAVYNANSSYVIHYRVAHLLASMELLEGLNNCLNVDVLLPWHLTERPRIIYNTDNTPKYYEFGYVINNQIVATVTTYATKEAAGVISQLFEDPLPYDCPELDYYVGRYPSRYYGSGGVCNMKSCDEYINEKEFGKDPTLTGLDMWQFLWSRISDEDQKEMLSDLLDEGSDIDKLEDEEQSKIDEYWQAVDKYIKENHSELLSSNESGKEDTLICDLDITEFIGGKTSTDNKSEADIIRELMNLLDRQPSNEISMTLPEYRDTNLQLTHWTGFCGPAACCWIYRGKYDKYDGNYLPVHNDYSVIFYFIDFYNQYAIYDYDNVLDTASLSKSAALANYRMRSDSADYGLAACFYDETIPFIGNHHWQFPLYHGGLNRGFKSATNGQYKVKFTMKPYDYMVQNTEPLIVETALSDGCGHYFVIFGYSATLTSNGDIADIMYKVTDNGTLIDMHGGKPYYKRSTFWNLHYGMKRLY